MTARETPEDALAAALKKEALRLADEWGLARRERNAALGFVGGLSTRLLVALPPGWCGHDPFHRERCHNYDSDAVIAHLHEANDAAEAELAQLRRELEVGGRLRAARLSLGLTQQQAAEITRENQGDISRMETGRFSPRGPRVVRYLSSLKQAATDGTIEALQATPLATTASEVAAYLLEIQSDEAAITPLKLQKLLYYAQGYALALFGQRLFPERIEAWPNGPVVPPVYEEFKRHGREVLPRPADFDVLSVDRRARVAIERTYADFGSVGARTLAAQTHDEAPWKDANATGRPNAEITVSAINSYFASRVGHGGSHPAGEE